MVREDLIGKCGIEREYFFDKSIYLEYFHNNGIIEGTLKKYIKVFANKDSTDYYLSSETPFINGDKNGTGIKYNLFDEPHIWLEYVNDELISLKSYFKDKDGNNNYFKFYFYNDMVPAKLEINDISFDLNFSGLIVRTEFKHDNMCFQIIFKDDSLQFYWNERCKVFDMSEFF